jgi:hypothetical protein
MKYKYINMYRTTQCPVCKEQPLTHSFFLYSESDDHAWFYSGEHHVPYVDRKVENVMKHIKGELDYFHNRCPDKPWSWVLDSKEFEFRWETVTLTIELIRLLRDDSTFSCLRVIHPNTFLRTTMDICRPFLTEDVLKKVRLEE